MKKQCSRNRGYEPDEPASSVGVKLITAGTAVIRWGGGFFSGWCSRTAARDYLMPLSIAAPARSAGTRFVPEATSRFELGRLSTVGFD